MVSEAQLEQITRLAEAAFSPKEVAYILGMEQEVFIAALEEDSHPINQAYFKGFYTQDLAVRESVFLLARSGSSPAQNVALKQLDDVRKELKRIGFHKV